MNNQVGLKYQGSKFETFLKYTNEKENSSVVLGKILRKFIDKDGISFLDVGSGNGEFLRLSLNRIKSLKGAEVTLLEPNGDLIRQLRLNVKNFPSDATVKIVHSTFDDFVTDSRFNIILTSHPPFRRNELSQVFLRMLNLLEPNGRLVVVLRKKDDVHKFRTTFKAELLKDKSYQSLTIDDAIETFNELAKIKPLRISTFIANSELHLPIAYNMEDAISIIEFFLNKDWEEIPQDIRKAVLSFVSKKNGVFHLTDCIALIEKYE